MLNPRQKRERTELIHEMGLDDPLKQAMNDPVAQLRRKKLHPLKDEWNIVTTRDRSLPIVRTMYIDKENRPRRVKVSNPPE